MKARQTYGREDMEIVGDELVYDGFFSMKKLALRHRLFAGGWTPVFHREVFCREEAACVLPYDPIRDEVILLEQFRIGAVDSDQSPWLIELVAGINDKNEQPVEVVRREGMEEAGIEIGECLSICEYFVSPGGATEKVHIFCGRVLAEGAGGIHGLPDECEDIKVHVLPREAACAMVESGEINNAASIIALQWLQLNYQKIRQRWNP
ncbi:MAG: ADP-ribose diphosphatase [Proteobacteria bacterium]|nr:MAG: ADP-ribose diphosphatase [Pseudomonadota bacterium]